MSVARPLRSTLEQVADALPDIVMLGIGIVIFAVFFNPIMSFVNSIRGVVGGTATIRTTGTTGHVRSIPYGTVGIQAPHLQPPNVTNPYQPTAPLVGAYTGNRYAWYYAYANPYSPINRFFRQLVQERQQ